MYSHSVSILCVRIEGMELGSDSIKAVIRKEVEDWDDEVAVRVRFKAFSGQRSDWEPTYVFWRNLILKMARHFRVFIIRPCQLKNDWFNRGGLTPLCLDHVLFTMYNEGDILLSSDLVDPTTGPFSQFLKKARFLLLRPTITSDHLSESHLILKPLLEEKAIEVVKLLSEGCWTSSCIVTMKKFQEICGGPIESSTLLSYLSGLGRARYFSITKKEFLEGIKISLSTTAVSTPTSLDFDVLHLIWTIEKLQQQLDVIDRRYEVSRNSALASLKSKNKKDALRHARELKMASESRAKCSLLLNRVEEVLTVIANAESTKKVSEAIQIGARAIRENKISVEEVEVCLQELDESIYSQKQFEETLESFPSYAGVEDEDIEEELRNLTSKVEGENPHPIPKTVVDSAVGKTEASAVAELLSDDLSKLKLDGAASRSKDLLEPS